MSSRLQLTLALLKPDVSLNERVVSQIRQLIIDNKFLFVRSQLRQLSLSEAKHFYRVHEHKFFYNRLVYSMSSGGPIWCHILARDNAIASWRTLMGPTKVFKAIYDQPDSIRGTFGTTDTRNATHGSDSVENAKSEIQFFFPRFDYDKWFEHDEEPFRNNLVTFDEQLIQHLVCKSQM